MATEAKNRMWSDLAVPPGELLEEELAAIGMTQQDLAVRAGRPVQVINEIVRGKKAITHDTALELAKVLGIPAHVWINLESTYQLTLAKNRERESLRSQEDWLSEFPVREMERRGWIQRYPDRSEKVRAVLEFLGVASFSAWQQAIAGLRVSEKAKVSIGALAVWLRKGELEVRAMLTQVYDEAKFRQALPPIRSMTNDAAATFVPKMQQLCADAGVAVAVVRELPKSGAYGVARWLTPNKGGIQMSLRGRWSDLFWFSFFHEAYHILSHDSRQLVIDGINGDPEVEAKANAFARDYLIAPDAWAAFVATSGKTRADVIRFAGEVGIQPGIVVGRMHFEKLIPYNQMADLKWRFVWKESAKGE